MANFNSCKMVVVSRVSARQDKEGTYIQDLDGSYLDAIAKGFREVEVLSPVHKKGIHVTYNLYKNYSYKFKSSNIRIVDMAGVKDYSQNIFSHLKRLYCEMKTIRQKVKQADMVFVFMITFKAVMAVKFCLKYKKPFIVYLGSDWENDAKYHYRWNRGMLKLAKYPYVKLCSFLERWVMKNSPAKIVNSPKLHKRYSPFGGYMEEARPIIQVEEKDCFYRRDTCSGKTIKLLSVAAIIPRKGLEYLIEGFMAAECNFPNIELHLVGVGGDGQYNEKLKKIINKSGISSKIYWHGYITNGPELFKAYRMADIFVLPTLSEGFPRVIWEAMSQSLPVITTKIDNICEKIGNQGLVHFVNSQSSSDISKAIVKVINCESYRRRLIDKSYVYVRNILKDSPAEQFLRIIQKVYNSGSEKTYS